MKFFDYIRDINDFFRKQYPMLEENDFPSIKLDNTEVDEFDPLISTGNYNPQTKTVTLFIDNRHLKDILRSYCHEMIHHLQNMESDEFINMEKGGTLNENKMLEEIEGDAYRRGNLMFRKWTEQFRK